MVWSSAGQARWCAKSDAFRFFIPLTELPTEGSFAGKLFSAEMAPATFAPVPADMWLDSQAAEQVDVLLEHSIARPNYNSVLTLLWVYKTVAGTTASGEDALEELEPNDFTLSRQRWPR